MTWAKTRIRHVAALNPAAPEWVTADPNGEFSFLPMEAIGEDATLRLDQTRPVNEVRNGYSFFADGDVAFAKVTPCFENGKAAVMSGLTGGAGFGTTEITVARPNKKILNRFLFYVLTDDTFRQLGKSAMTGAGGLRRVPDLFTKDYSFAMPSTDHQYQIVDFLDSETAQIDDLIGKQERLIELLAEKRQAVITQAVTKGLDPNVPTKPSGIPWIGDIPLHWGLGPVKHHYNIVLGKMLQREQEVETDTLRPFLKAASVKSRKLAYDETIQMWFSPTELRNLSLCAGDILVVEGGSIGQSAVIEHDIPTVGFEKSLNRVRPKLGSSSKYFQLYMTMATDSGYVAMQCVGATFMHLTSEKLGRMIMPVPPPCEQIEIGLHTNKTLQQIDLASKRSLKLVSLLRERRSALISAAVTGKIDVREGVV